jgi:hypothetical protein
VGTFLQQPHFLHVTVASAVDVVNQRGFQFLFCPIRKRKMQLNISK